MKNLLLGWVLGVIATLGFVTVMLPATTAEPEVSTGVTPAAPPLYFTLDLHQAGIAAGHVLSTGKHTEILVDKDGYVLCSTQGGSTRFLAEPEGCWEACWNYVADVVLSDEDVCFVVDGVLTPVSAAP